MPSLYYEPKETTMTRLDYYDIRPAGLDAYLSHNGYHFNKQMCDWAVSMMIDHRSKKPMTDPYTKERVETLLRNQGIELENDRGYDAVYVANMLKADYLGGSIPDEAHLALGIREVIDDPDGYEGLPFTRFLADCNGAGVPVMWLDMI